MSPTLKYHHRILKRNEKYVFFFYSLFPMKSLNKKTSQFALIFIPPNYFSTNDPLALQPSAPPHPTSLKRKTLAITRTAQRRKTQLSTYIPSTVAAAASALHISSLILRLYIPRARATRVSHPAGAYVYRIAGVNERARTHEGDRTLRRAHARAQSGVPLTRE